MKKEHISCFDCGKPVFKNSSAENVCLSCYNKTFSKKQPYPSYQFILDGIKVNLIKQKDLDNDGRIGGIETIKMNDNPDEQDMIQTSELKEVISELNEDKLNKEGMSPIDMKTKLTSMEKIAYHAFDALITMKFLPKSASSISRIGKRLNKSIDGDGIKAIVDIVGRSQEQKKSLIGNLTQMGGQVK